MTTRIGPFAALDWRFTIDCSNPVLAQELQRVLTPLSTSRGSAEVARYGLASPVDARLGHLTVDGRALSNAYNEHALFSRLLWHVNLSAVRTSTSHVLLHAAAAELDGVGVVLCAPMEAGKTTLVAGLVMSGMRYLTDEITAIDPETGRIRPFPKSLSIDEGSWEVLAELRPPADEHLEHLRPTQWQVPVTDIRPDAVSVGASPAVVVLPRYVPGAATTIKEVTPGQAMMSVLQQTFGLERQRRRDMRVLGRVLGRARCYELRSGCLAGAVGAVRNLTA